MDFNSFSGDLRQRASHNHRVDLGFRDFPSTSGDRRSPTTPITNPFPNHHNLNTVASMADFDVGLCQNLSNMSIYDEDGQRRSTFTGFCPFLNPSSFGSSNLDGHLLQSFNGEASMADCDVGLCQNFSKMGIFDEDDESSTFTGFRSFLNHSRNLDGRLTLEQDLRDRREGLLQSFNGEASMDGYVDNGDSQRLRLLDLQDFTNPNPNPRDFMSPHEASMLYNGGNRAFPPFSAIGGSQELESMNKKLFFKEDSHDWLLNLASIVEIYGSMYLMAKDQTGCRLLQRFIEEGSFVDLIFREVIYHVIELGIDPLGNFLIQKLLEVCNEEQRTQILIVVTSKPGLLVKISINNYGTWVVQKLIQTSSTKKQISLVKSALKPGLFSLIQDSNGNHVILKCLKSFYPNDNEFILEAATKSCVEIATHPTGCCILKQCVLYSVEAQREKLVAEISRNSLHLAQDPYGNYMVQYLLEHKWEGTNVLFELRGNYVNLATQKFGSHVVEKCLQYCSQSRSHIVRELLSDPEFEHLLQDPYANYVIQSAISLTKGFVRMRLVEKVRQCRNIMTSPYCKKLFSKSILKK